MSRAFEICNEYDLVLRIQSNFIAPGKILETAETNPVRGPSLL